MLKLMILQWSLLWHLMGFQWNLAEVVKWNLVKVVVKWEKTRALIQTSIERESHTHSSHLLISTNITMW